MRMPTTLKVGPVAVVLAATLMLLMAGPELLVAQAEALGQQRLGRPYWFVFTAYAVGWALILGWIVSIARRLGRVEARLQKSSD